MSIVPPQKCRTFVSDHAYGKEGEYMVEVETVLKGKFKGELIHTTSPFAPWDAFGLYKGKRTGVAEIKRRYKRFKDEIETTVLKYLKVERASKLDIPVWFIFIFTDGIWGIQYNKEQFDKYERRVEKLPDRVDFQEVPEERIYISLKDLTCFVRFESKPLFVDDE
jgi:hypothetical protein